MALLAELRAHERQAAEELGQWVEQHEEQNGINLVALLKCWPRARAERGAGRCSPRGGGSRSARLKRAQMAACTASRMLTERGAEMATASGMTLAERRPLLGPRRVGGRAGAQCRDADGGVTHRARSMIVAGSYV